MKPTTTSLQRADGSTLRVLVVEDDLDLNESLVALLSQDGWDAAGAATVADAHELAGQWHPDAVVLDVGLPDGSGLSLLGQLRALDPEMNVIFLTARDTVLDRVTGIEVGGDDYLTKPFSTEELLARLRGLVRRSGRNAAAAPGTLVVGDLWLAESSREVRRGGDAISLTSTEFDLLLFLMRNVGRVVSKAQILDAVWHYDFGGNAHVVELYISYLRRKIDVDRAPMIHTVRAVGYLLKSAT